MLSSPEKKRKRKTTTTKKKTPPTTTNPSLPDDLILSIIARVSRLYYPTLSLVSKKFRSLLTSPDLYKFRSLLGHTESCLYVCLKTSTGCIWFTLCRKPNQTLTNNAKKKSGYVLAKVPIPRSPNAVFSSLMAVGSNIYNIGACQSHFEASSSTVFVLDCTTHTWREAPRMPEKLFTLSASVLDGKIYVAGSANGDNDSDRFKNSFEVFDTRTQVWDPNPTPCIVGKDMSLYKSACPDGKFHVMAGSKVAAYNAKEGIWDLVRPGMSGYMFQESDHCEIDNVLYCFSRGALRWYDTQTHSWRDLMGLVGLPKLPLPDFPRDACVRLADYDGKLAVLWAEFCFYWFPYKNKIWCAEISLERRKSCEIWGKVEWFDHVLTVPITHGLVNLVAATV